MLQSNNIHRPYTNTFDKATHQKERTQKTQREHKAGSLHAVDTKRSIGLLQLLQFYARQTKKCKGETHNTPDQINK